MTEYLKDVDARKFEPHYCKHVNAMTTENLHRKSDIAVELARRDAEIEVLRAAADENKRLRGLLGMAYPIVCKEGGRFCGLQMDIKDALEQTSSKGTKENVK